MSPAAAGPATPSVEEAYRIKCIELRRRISEVQADTDQRILKRARLARQVKKMRMERAVLLDAIKQRMPKGDIDGAVDEESEDSSDSPPTPQERPLRTKKSHRRITTSPGPGSNNGPSASNTQTTNANTQGTAAQPSQSQTNVTRSAESTQAIDQLAAAAAASSSADGRAAQASHGASQEESEAFGAFMAHLMDDVLPTDPHGEAELKSEFGGNREEYASKKWAELPEMERQKWSKMRGKKSGRKSAGGDVEMGDAAD